MIRINVAPETIVTVSAAPLLRALAVSIVCILVFYFVPKFYADALSNETEEIIQKTTEKKNQLVVLKLDVSKAKSLQEKLKELKNRATQIRVLSDGRQQPVLVLDKLQQNHLERMWFDGLKMAKGKVSISGIALDHTIIAEYVHRLKSLDADEDLELLNIREFVPPFLKEHGLKTSPLDDAKNVAPFKLSAVSLKKSTAELVDGVTLQKFEAEFQTSMP